jgi:HD-GYP domain-containing protein (c-di-GMP phosphodiesterase class II)
MQAAEREHRERLAAQRASAELCQRQFDEAGQAWSTAMECVLARPEQARRDTESLTRALLDKMLVDGDMCIRLLTCNAGDSASAHAMNVAVISLLMGRVFNLGDAEMLDLGLGALLHDVGKIDLPERLRHADERFAKEDIAAYREHVAHGVVHGRRMGLGSGALLVLAQHHEHADGSGFPLRLKSERMSTAASIVALVNRYDNLCNPVSLAQSHTPHEALSLMFAQARSQFDASMLNSFIRMMGVYPAGSVVQLTDDRYALVMSVNSTRPLKPNVLVHDPRWPRDEALHLNLMTTPDLGIRRSLKPSQLPPDALEYLAPRPRVAYFFDAVRIEPATEEDAVTA